MNDQNLTFSFTVDQSRLLTDIGAPVPAELIA
jgi:hypothetical protein